MQTHIHLFEEAGLGKAPFEYLYCQDSKGSTCQFCGASIRWKFFLKSQDGKIFHVGSDCILKHDHYGLVDIVKREKSRIAKEIRQEKLAKKYEEKRKAFEEEGLKRYTQFREDHKQLDEVLDWASTATGAAKDIFDKLRRYGSISDAQINYVQKLYNAEQNKSTNPKNPCPTGEHIVEGVVLSIKDTYTRFGEVTKMLVESCEGYKVFGTIPKHLEVSVGSTVKIKAILTPSDTDQFFGFYTYPKIA